MIDYGKLYDEFLYDCYIANQRLTEEDWRYYGKEEHHIEIPKRDGGLLTPTNSQYLTTYQHWVAGVLQSEVLGKCCFAFIPKSILQNPLEQLRLKWEILKLTPEQRREQMLKGLANRDIEKWAEQLRLAREARTFVGMSEGSKKKWANKTPEERSRIMREMHQNRTPEERSATVKKAWEKRDRTLKSTPEQRSDAIRKGWETRRNNPDNTPERRSEIIRKGWETRRRKQQDG